MRIRWPSSIALGLGLLGPACRGRAPDVAAFSPVLVEDGRIVELLSEADALSDRDPVAAARDLRTTVLPRARANAGAAAQVQATHPRARALADELRRIAQERAATVERYADALAGGDTRALRDAVHRQIALDRAVDRLEGDVQSARATPAEGGCSGG